MSDGQATQLGGGMASEASLPFSPAEGAGTLTARPPARANLTLLAFSIGAVLLAIGGIAAIGAKQDPGVGPVRSQPIETQAPREEPKVAEPPLPAVSDDSGEVGAPSSGPGTSGDRDTPPSPREPRVIEASASPKPLAEPPTEAVSNRVEVQFDSEPSGAIVSFEGKQIGRTPFSLSVERGRTLDLTFRRSGYRPARRSVTAEDGAAVEVVLERRQQVDEPEVVAPLPEASRKVSDLK
ncbi:MAG: PEGA domain-containing protein [Myxococcales bacterium]|nr:PEGA domain-containing protein [Myxococcales bacterium]